MSYSTLIVISALVFGSLISLLPGLALVILFLVFLLYQGYRRFEPIHALYLFIIFLPVYQLSMVFFLFLSSNPSLLPFVQSWKELLVFTTLIIALIPWLRTNIRTGWNAERPRTFSLTGMDALMMAYFCLNIVYLFIPNGTFVTRLYALRSDAFMVPCYFLGRLIYMSDKQQKNLIRYLCYLAFISGIGALIDRFLLPSDWPAQIGLMDYLNRHSGSELMSVRGLSWSFWTSTMVRRTSAFFANPLDLASSIHLSGMAALVFWFTHKLPGKKRYFGPLCFALSFVAILFTISRTSIVVFFVQCFVGLFLLRRMSLALVVALFLACVASIGLTIPDIHEFAKQTIQWSNESSLGHLSQWQEGLAAVKENPLGLGLGTSSYVGSLFGRQIGGESQYITILVELGVLGLFLYTMLHLFGGLYALRLSRSSPEGSTRQLGLIVALARLGLALLGLTCQIEIYLFVSYVGWWLTGFAVQSATMKAHRGPILARPEVGLHQACGAKPSTAHLG